jgi:outer membrane protein TolC
MRDSVIKRPLALGLLSSLLFAKLALGQELPAKDKPGKNGKEIAFPAPVSILPKNAEPIDLAAALQLAGVQNPEIRLAQERVTEAIAERQIAAAQFLPSLQAGFNVNAHQGTLMETDGTVIRVNRESMYLGLGAGAVGAGTVTVPGVVWANNLSQVYFQTLYQRQRVRVAQWQSEAERNQVLLRVATAYVELLRAQGKHAVFRQSRKEAVEIARATANFAKVGEGRKADADRALVELELKNSEITQMEAEVLQAAARLAQLLNLSPATRLLATDNAAAPAPIVPDAIPLPELLAMALVQRPELKANQAAIQAALVQLRNAKVLPFSPNVLLGYSAGSYGGGGSLAFDQARFGNFDGRQDLDVVVYWSLRNLGLGNRAQVKLGESQVRQAQWREIETLDRIRAEVASAHAKTQARLGQIGTTEKAVAAAQSAFNADLTRTRNGKGLPIETVNSYRLLAQSRAAYLDAILDYNRAHFELYVALGQPPAPWLMRPVPSTLVAPLEEKSPASK